MKRSSFLKSLALGSSCIFIPKLIKPVWGSNRKVIVKRDWVMDSEMMNKYRILLDNQREWITANPLTMEEIINPQTIEDVFDEIIKRGAKEIVFKTSAVPPTESFIGYSQNHVTNGYITFGEKERKLFEKLKTERIT